MSRRNSKTEGFAFFGTNSIRQRNVVRIVAMLTKLLERFDPEQFRVLQTSRNYHSHVTHSINVRLTK
jgi:hypothetical protein